MFIHCLHGETEVLLCEKETCALATIKQGVEGRSAHCSKGAMFNPYKHAHTGWTDELTP